MRYLFFLFSLLSFLGCQTHPSDLRRCSMRVGFEMDPTTLDPRKNGDPCTSYLQFLLYEGLVRLDPDGTTRPALAESVEVSDDQTVYTFHLRDAQWSDGVPITAADFEHTWKTTLDPSFGAVCPYLFYPIKNGEEAHQGKMSVEAVGVKALDDKTLQVELENPTPYFLSLITFCNFFAIPKHVEIKDPLWFTKESSLVTSGPFRLARWAHNEEVALAKNSTYWNADQVSLETMSLVMVPSSSTAVQMFRTGEIDHLTTSTTPLEVDDLILFQKENKLHIHPVGGLFFCTFNLEKEPFQNKNIRRALSLAIDRNAIVSQITRLGEEAATRVIPPMLMGGRSRTLFPAYDPTEAVGLLEKGLEELKMDKQDLSKILTLTYISDPLSRKIGQTIQHQWKSILGLDTVLSEHDRKTLAAIHMGKNYSVGLDRILVQYNDAYNVLERFKHKNAPKNYPSFEEPRYIELLDESAKALSTNERLALLEEAEKVLAEEMPIAPLYHYTRADLIDPKFQNVAFSPLGRLLYEQLEVQR